jgi:hypothetical protein
MNRSRFGTRVHVFACYLAPNDEECTLNDYPEGTKVEVRYPVDGQQARGDREAWPWLSGVVEDRGGPDEWTIVVTAREAAMLEDGTPAPDGTPDDDLYQPVVFRDSSEIRMVAE